MRIKLSVHMAASCAQEHRSARHLAEQLLEQGPRECVPGDRVRHGSEDPIELSQGRLAICLLAGDAVYEVPRQPLAAQEALGAEPPQCHLRTASDVADIKSYVYTPPLSERQVTSTLCGGCQTGQKGLALMGVVRHAVKTSAGRSGFCGSTSFAPQAASRMHSFMGSSAGGCPDLMG